MPNVLVFPCGSEIGLELCRSLAHSAHFTVFGASSVEDHGCFAYERYLEIKSMVGDVDFLGEFNQMLAEHGIEFILPAHDSALLAFAEFQDRGELKAVALVPDAATAAVCRSKSSTYRRFFGLTPVPRCYAPEDIETAVFPLFAKPDAGQGSKGATLVQDLAAARERLRTAPDSLLMEYLPGHEYTIDCLTDRHGKLRFLAGRERRRVVNGISVNVRRIDNPAFRRIGEMINSQIPLRGAWFFQIRENADGEPVLLEIAPRIAGASGFQRAQNVNLALLSLYDRMEHDIEIMEARLDGLEYDRALAGSFRFDFHYKAAYIDFDDTLIRRDGTVDTDLVKFVFQCRNQGIRVVLLTRHLGDIAESLARYRLTGIFDKVIPVPSHHSKSRFIKEKDAIFIDDSFSERAEVSRTLGIPVFDPSAVETLLDWRG